MTFAAVPALNVAPELGREWLPKILANGYDPRNVPHTQKTALTIGMGMTEKQGGSDVRANTTTARSIGWDAGLDLYELVGHKWFTSAPMCDAFLMLAQAPGGLSCFLVPRWRPDGHKNGIEVQRLKNKMGNVSNASSEIELRNAFGWRVGDEGRGVRTIMEMVAMTRFDCMLGSAASQRQGVAQAIHHATHRRAFGEALVRQPLMRNVLADLQLEVEGSLAIALRMARALDRPGDDRERLLLRIGPAGRQVLDMQKEPATRVRGDGMSRRQWRDRRLHHRAPLPRRADQRDLGRLGERAGHSTCCARFRRTRMCWKRGLPELDKGARRQRGVGRRGRPPQVRAWPTRRTPNTEHGSSRIGWH
jgi:hypothetical protein